MTKAPSFHGPSMLLPFSRVVHNALSFCSPPPTPPSLLLPLAAPFALQLRRASSTLSTPNHARSLWLLPAMCKYSYVYYTNCRHAELTRTSYCDTAWALGLIEKHDKYRHLSISSGRLQPQDRRATSSRHSSSGHIISAFSQPRLAGNQSLSRAPNKAPSDAMETSLPPEAVPPRSWAQVVAGTPEKPSLPASHVPRQALASASASVSPRQNVGRGYQQHPASSASPLDRTDYHKLNINIPLDTYSGFSMKLTHEDDHGHTRTSSTASAPWPSLPHNDTHDGHAKDTLSRQKSHQALTPAEARSRAYSHVTSNSNGSEPSPSSARSRGAATAKQTATRNSIKTKGHNAANEAGGTKGSSPQSSRRAIPERWTATLSKSSGPPLATAARAMQREARKKASQSELAADVNRKSVRGSKFLVHHVEGDAAARSPTHSPVTPRHATSMSTLKSHTTSPARNSANKNTTVHFSVSPARGSPVSPTLSFKTALEHWDDAPELDLTSAEGDEQASRTLHTAKSHNRGLSESYSKVSPRSSERVATTKRSTPTLSRQVAHVSEVKSSKSGAPSEVAELPSTPFHDPQVSVLDEKPSHNDPWLQKSPSTEIVTPKPELDSGLTERSTRHSDDPQAAVHYRGQEFPSSEPWLPQERDTDFEPTESAGEPEMAEVPSSPFGESQATIFDDWGEKLSPNDPWLRKEPYTNDWGDLKPEPPFLRTWGSTDPEQSSANELEDVEPLMAEETTFATGVPGTVSDDGWHSAESERQSPPRAERTMATVEVLQPAAVQGLQHGMPEAAQETLGKQSIIENYLEQSSMHVTASPATQAAPQEDTQRPTLAGPGESGHESPPSNHPFLYDRSRVTSINSEVTVKAMPGHTDNPFNDPSIIRVRMSTDALNTSLPSAQLRGSGARAPPNGDREDRHHKTLSESTTGLRADAPAFIPQQAGGVRPPLPAEWTMRGQPQQPEGSGQYQMAPQPMAPFDPFALDAYGNPLYHVLYPVQLGPGTMFDFQSYQSYPSPRRGRYRRPYTPRRGRQTRNDNAPESPSKSHSTEESTTMGGPQPDAAFSSSMAPARTLSTTPTPKEASRGGSTGTHAASGDREPFAEQFEEISRHTADLGLSSGPAPRDAHWLQSFNTGAGSQHMPIQPPRGPRDTRAHTRGLSMTEDVSYNFNTIPFGQQMPRGRQAYPYRHESRFSSRYRGRHWNTSLGAGVPLDETAPFPDPVAPTGPRPSEDEHPKGTGAVATTEYVGYVLHNGKGKGKEKETCGKIEVGRCCEWGGQICHTCDKNHQGSTPN
ncbi:hypothetical protein M011DRAFT_348730 [Sporormia fimetaria CBS 119925]|uniref:Uncharacterized protein n=1 Tax=Sporormia fimetaria CBS 119925 TaxID=1340428 RepID=A0A6A6VCT0_9PLEO|nr:hypothetical protein M011DRAFT_348730 [Sporormia fimetaria CBS 119925]